MDAAFAGRHGALIVPLFSHTHHHSLLCDDIRYMSCCDNKHRHNISEYIDYPEPGENDFWIVFVISLFSPVGSHYYVPGMI